MTYRLNIHNPDGREMIAGLGRTEYHKWFQRAYFALPGLNTYRYDPNWDSTTEFELHYGVKTGPAGLTFEGGKRRFEYVEFESEAEAVLFLLKV